MPRSDRPVLHDAIVIGAGMCGVYQLHRLRELGLDAIAIEAGDDVGGAWYWNRYPGARFDSESYTYAYSFSPEIVNGWNWSELFAGQPEVQRYVSFAVETLGLRPHIRFGHGVVRAVYSESDRAWDVETDDGIIRRARLLLTAVGVLSVPSIPTIEGMGSFTGPIFHTSRWPKEPLDLSDKRVAVIGTGSSGVQVITELAGKVKDLTVFQRHPTWGAPLGNRPIPEAEMESIRSRYDEIWERCLQSPGGFVHVPDRRRVAELSDEEITAFWEKLWSEPGFAILLGNFLDTSMDEEANARLSAFAADKIRERVDDPEIAEKLIPKDHGFGTRRLSLESGYYEVYNRPDVHLVSLLEDPIVSITPHAIETAHGHHDVDVIILATGFDAVTGSFDAIEFVGNNGMRLRDKWAENPITYLGIQTHGFPNLLMVAGPQAGSGAANAPRGIEDGVNWVTGLVKHMRDHGYTRIETTVEAETRWVEHVADRLSKMLVGRTKSWFTGFNTNKKGRDKPRLLLYMGGNPLYRKILGEVEAQGYDGFVFDADDRAPQPTADSVS